MIDQNSKGYIADKTEKLLLFLQTGNEQMAKLRSPLSWLIYALLCLVLSVFFIFIHQIVAAVFFIVALMSLGYGVLLIGRKQMAEHFILLGQSLYNAPQGALITKLSGEAIWCNRAFRMLLPGVLPPDVKRGNILEGLGLYLANREDIEAVHRMLQLAATGFEDRMIIMVRLPNGEPASRYIFVSPVDGQKAILWQITQLQEDALALSSSLAEPSSDDTPLEEDTITSGVLSGIPCAWFSMNEEGVVHSANEGFLNLVGVSQAQISKGDFFLSDYIVDAKPMQYDDSSYLLQGRESQNMNGFVHIRRGENSQMVKAWLYQNPQLNEKGHFESTNSILIPEPHGLKIEEGKTQPTHQKNPSHEAIANKVQSHEIQPQRGQGHHVQLSDIPIQFTDMPLPLVWIDRRRNIKKVSRAFKELFDQSESDLIGHPLSALFPKDEKQRLQTFLYRVSIGAHSLTIEGLKGTDENSHLSIRLYVLNTTLESSDDILLVAEDLSETYALRAQRSAAEKDRMIGQNAGKVIHDFKNMLAAIIGGAESIIDRIEQEDDIYPDAHTILESAFRANGLAQWLNRMNRSETGERLWVNMNDLITHAKGPMGSVLGRSLTLKIQRCNDICGAVIEETAFDQILMNLITNARDAMQDGGIVQVSCEKHVLNQVRQGFPDHIPSGEWVVVSVQDNGSGIEEPVLKRIFENRFTTKKAGMGTGIGLDSVRQMVRAQDGFINIKSVLNKGSRFEIWLPYAKEVKSTPHTNKKYIPKDLSGVGRILVVEDEERARAYTARALRQRGYEVIEARDGQEGLETIMAHHGRFDLIISDISMPRLDGPNMIEKARETYAHIPVLIISGNSGEDLDRDLDKIGSVPFLAKPYSLEGLVIRVKSILTEVKKATEISEKNHKPKDLFSILSDKNNETIAHQSNQQQIKSARLKEVENTQNTTSKPLILLVDDEEAARIFTARKLQKSGFDVFEAGDGEEGLQLAFDPENRKALQAVVTDVNMIMMHGPEMAEIIWREMPEMPIIFLSGDMGEWRDQIRNPHAYYMEKPVSPSKILEKVKEILEI